ncbi:carbonic anhydrase [Altererythrobacter aquiaggeris]|uniref:carbonic anhydrase n=1 Tax=Aestuarierythrobacter aquiaggeris TaxID=1898396 RepID=UPI0030185D8A
MPEFAQLLEGYRRFQKNAYAQQRERYDRLASHGQSPKLMVIACSDSRVDPAQVFDVDPGQVFVVRNVAALVPPYETTPGLHGVSAALEFAVEVLKVRQIVVMGHGMCGGCKAALTRDLHGTEPGHGGFIANWISMLDSRRDAVIARHGTTGPEAERAMEHEGVKVSLQNLRTFPNIKQKEAEGSLVLRGTFFAIADGVLHLLDEKSGEFAPAD